VTLEIRLTDRIAEIAEADWNALLAPDSSPFVEWAWLEALEQSGCIDKERGWLARHVTVWREGALVAAVPAYIKGNSEGEFVFDHQWAAVASRHFRSRWYPKMIFAVPFTPATGDRVLALPGVDRDAIRAAIADVMPKICEQLELSSAHLLFPRRDEQDVFVDHKWIRRHGVQYHWYNDGFKTFEDFLATLPSKKRTQIRRERRAVRESGIVVETRRGDAIDDATIAFAYKIYLTTVDKFTWGRRYLNEKFFRLIRERWAKDRLEIVVAREGDQLLAGAINLHKNDRLYGRYWGTIEDRPFLHFEVCFYHSIDESIARGTKVFEPGAGGEHKRARGFRPTLTNSAHYIADPRLRDVLADYCAREAEYLERVVSGEVIDDS
jgi:predicted N-acyltransferase